MNEIVEANTHQQMVALIDNALVNPDVDVTKMQAILDVQERIYDKNAQIAFNKAMAACQQEMPAIAKTAENLQTNSKYAKYETIITDTKPVYTKHGFSISFGEEDSPKPDHIRVIADLMHSQGHCKAYHADLPLDLAGIKGTTNKTAVHATGSTFSYTKRYLFCMIFNVALANEDDDAVKAGAITVQDLLEHIGFVRDNFDAVSQIKEGINGDDYESAAMAWCDLGEQEKRLLWRAPTKGGILTTAEREQLKSAEFRDACIAIMPGTKKAETIAKGQVPNVNTRY